MARPYVCSDTGVFVPPSEPCDACEELAREFEEAKEQAIGAAADAQEAAEQAQTAAQNAMDEAADAKSAAEAAIDAATRGEALYGMRWDRATNIGTRLFGAAGITMDTTNFKHSGTFNENIVNPFDTIYPWSEIVTCNVDLAAYRQRSGQESLKNFITAVYGDPDFTYQGTKDLFVGVYYPEFWYKSEEDSLERVTFLVSPTERVGFKHSEEKIYGIGCAIDAGVNENNQRVITCGTGVPFTDVAGSTLHQYAKNSGFTIEDINAVDALTTLFFVEYADMNSQHALGDGCSNCYRQNATDAISNVSVGADSTTFTITDAALSSVVYKGAQADFGASEGAHTYRGIITDFAVNGSTYTITVKPALALSDGLIMSIHGFDACEFPAIGASVGSGSGYIGTNGKANAWYRGCMIHANRYRYILGIYRQANTNHLWLCEDADPDDYDALNTAVHNDTGCALPILETGAWQTVGSNAQRITGLAAFMATGTSEGSSLSPVGDQQYVPAASTGNTVLWLGCCAFIGWYCGVLGCYWGTVAGLSGWPYAVRPLLQKSL